ncbi:hypothetical protein AG1IA_10029 [Rhizoctonia solani AG-1 IA]|uniref:Uncharacterized protein n=1 Tax=Thanatephorus cucumeris (strain AG1-IA) TaxID=983506 RepID=L8WCP1_THACA|nr:hypothetical protein AG1IA_10029 [Rhizoctonia solani AG-1 IA]
MMDGARCSKILILFDRNVSDGGRSGVGMMVQVGKIGYGGVLRKSERSTRTLVQPVSTKREPVLTLRIGALLRLEHAPPWALAPTAIGFGSSGLTSVGAVGFNPLVRDDSQPYIRQWSNVLKPLHLARFARRIRPLRFDLAPHHTTSSQPSAQITVLG